MFSTFTAIFEALDNLEEELHQGVDSKEKAKIEETLLSLRNTMDKCIHYWIQFEERVASLQENYNLSLPDNLPDSFLENITSSEKPKPNSSNTKNDANCLPEKKDPSDNHFLGYEASTAFNTSKLNDLDNQNLEKMKEYEQHLQKTFSKLFDENVAISFRKGLGFWDLAMVEDAVNEFEKVTNAEPDFITGHFFLGLSCSHQGNYERACKELKLVIALDSDQILKALAYNTLGSIYADEGKFTVALDNFQKAVELKEDLKEAYFNQGAVNFCLQKYSNALKAFNKYLHYDPDDWEALLYAGKSCGHIQDCEKALDYLEKAYSLNPREPRITFELGVLYRLLEKNHKAAIYLQKTKTLVTDQKKP